MKKKKKIAESGDQMLFGDFDQVVLPMPAAPPKKDAAAKKDAGEKKKTVAGAKKVPGKKKGNAVAKGNAVPAEAAVPPDEAVAPPVVESVVYRKLGDFVRNRFKYCVMERRGDVALYSQSALDYDFVVYNVVVIQRHEGFEIGGNWVEPGESYPSDGMWGSKGWTYQTEEFARREYEKLVILEEEKAAAKRNEKENA